MTSQDYIHPIIQAIGQIQAANQAAAERKLQAAGQAETSRANKARESEAAARLKQEKEIQDAAHALAQSTLDINKQHLQHEESVNDFLTKLHATQQGVKFGQPNPSTIPNLLNSIRPSSAPSGIPQFQSQSPLSSSPTSIQLPGLGNVDLSGASPEAAGVREIQRKVAEYQAQEHAKIPFTEAANAAETVRQLAVGKQTQEAKKEEDRLNRESAITLEKMKADSAARVANIAAHASLLKAANGLEGAVSPANIIAYGTGEGNFEANTPADQATRSAAEAGGIRRFDPKQKDSLIAMQSLNPVFKKLDTFVNNYLPDEKSGSTKAKIAAYVKGKITGSSLPTDARNELDQIKTNALNYAKVIEGSTGGRVTVQQMELALAGLADSGKTKQQGQALIQNLKDQFVNKEQNVILGGMSDTQKDMIAKRYGITLNSPGGKVATKLHIADYAKQKGITVDAATKEFTNAGYEVR